VAAQSSSIEEAPSPGPQLAAALSQLSGCSSDTASVTDTLTLCLAPSSVSQLFATTRVFDWVHFAAALPLLAVFSATREHLVSRIYRFCCAMTPAWTVRVVVPGAVPLKTPREGEHRGSALRTPGDGESVSSADDGEICEGEKAQHVLEASLITTASASTAAVAALRASAMPLTVGAISLSTAASAVGVLALNFSSAAASAFYSSTALRVDRCTTRRMHRDRRLEVFCTCLQTSLQSLNQAIVATVCSSDPVDAVHLVEFAYCGSVQLASVPSGSLGPFATCHATSEVAASYGCARSMPSAVPSVDACGMISAGESARSLPSEVGSVVDDVATFVVPHPIPSAASRSVLRTLSPIFVCELMAASCLSLLGEVELSRALTLLASFRGGAGATDRVERVTDYSSIHKRVLVNLLASISVFADCLEEVAVPSALIGLGCLAGVCGVLVSLVIPARGARDSGVRDSGAIGGTREAVEGELPRASSGLTPLPVADYLTPASVEDLCKLLTVAANIPGFSKASMVLHVVTDAVLAAPVRAALGMSLPLSTPRGMDEVYEEAMGQEDDGVAAAMAALAKHLGLPRRVAPKRRPAGRSEVDFLPSSY